MMLACVLLIYLGFVLLFWFALTALADDVDAQNDPSPVLLRLLLVALWPLVLCLALPLGLVLTLRDCLGWQQEDPC